MWAFALPHTTLVLAAGLLLLREGEDLQARNHMLFHVL